MIRTGSPNTIAGVHSAADPVVRDLLDDPDDEAADDGALEVADAAHDGRGEGDQAGREALVEPDVGLYSA